MYEAVSIKWRGEWHVVHMSERSFTVVKASDRSVVPLEELDDVFWKELDKAVKNKGLYLAWKFAIRMGIPQGDETKRWRALRRRVRGYLEYIEQLASNNVGNHGHTDH